MKNLILRVVIFLLVSVPFMGCSQNENIITPPDSIEVIPITVVFDSDRPEDSLLYITCDLSDEDANYSVQGLNIFYEDSLFTTVYTDNIVIHPRLCTGARKVDYPRDTKMFILWREYTYGDAVVDQLSLKVDHYRKICFFEASVKVKTHNGVVLLDRKDITKGLLIPKFDKSYTFNYSFKEKIIR